MLHIRTFLQGSKWLLSLHANKTSWPNRSNENIFSNIYSSMNMYIVLIYLSLKSSKYYCVISIYSTCNIHVQVMYTTCSTYWFLYIRVLSTYMPLTTNISVIFQYTSISCTYVWNHILQSTIIICYTLILSIHVQPILIIFASMQISYDTCTYGFYL